MLEDMDFAISKLGEVANKVQELVNFLNPYCGVEKQAFDETKEVETEMKQKTNEMRGGDSEWISMDDLIGKEFEESDNGEGDWSGKFNVGDQVTWIDPECPDEPSPGWEVVDAPEDDGVVDPDDIYVIVNNETGSEAEVLGSELRSATMVNEANDTIPADEFLDKVLDDAEDTNDVFDVYDGTVLEDNEVVLNVNVYKDEVEDWDVKEEFRTMPRKYGWEYDGWEYSSDVTGDDNTEILVYFKPMK